MPSDPRPADLVLTGGHVHTVDPAHPRAEALAVRDGVIVAVGDAAEVDRFVGPGTEVVDLAGRMLIPGLVDVHSHLGLGGMQAAFELPLSPAAGLEEVLAAVRAWAVDRGPDEWITGGIVGSPTMALAGTADARRALDDAAGGRPVMLRDDSMHNRWVSSRALELMGVTADTPDPDGGHYVRDDAGEPVGILHEMASAVAEKAVADAVPPGVDRHAEALRTAVAMLNSYGITATQEAATMAPWLRTLAELDRAGDLDAWVVGSMPARPFLEFGPVGAPLWEEGATHRTDHVLPDFVKAVVDGVPMTRTSAFLEPYRDEPGGHVCEFRGEPYFELDDLVALLRECADRGLGVKLHATADASARLVLDAVEQVRASHGAGPRFQIAHASFIHPDDLPRFAALDVVADASPCMWFPSPLTDGVGAQLRDGAMDRMWPLRELLDSGASVAAGSDWPCALPTPDPWIGIEALVTRRNPDPAFPGALGAHHALTLAEALQVYTVGPARAMGLGDRTGRLAVGLSADLALLDRDLFDIPVTEVHATRVLRTWFAGRLVHARDEARS